MRLRCRCAGRRQGSRRGRHSFAASLRINRRENIISNPPSQMAKARMACKICDEYYRQQYPLPGIGYSERRRQP
eukprot:2143991-Pleurochrysis_carterae.AAC.1